MLLLPDTMSGSRDQQRVEDVVGRSEWTAADSLGMLLPAEVPPVWRGAVLAAGRLLGALWPVGDTVTATAVVAVYTLAEESGRSPDAVAVSELVELLRAASAGRTGLEARARKAAAAGGGGTVVAGLLSWVAASADVPVYETGEEPPGELDWAAGLLATRLGALGQDDIDALPEPPEPTGPLTLAVGRSVLLVDHRHGSHSVRVLDCVPCREAGTLRPGGWLRTEGWTVVWTCVCGHPTDLSRLVDPRRIRGALRWTPPVLPDPAEPGTVFGVPVDLPVCGMRMAPEADPRTALAPPYGYADGTA